MLVWYVAIGGAFGAMLRYLMMSWVSQIAPANFPYSTLVVNILGSLLLGVMVALVAILLPKGRELHALVAIGMLGSFTTFSTFAMDSFLMMERGEYWQTASYIVASVVISILAFFGGMWLFRSVV